MALPLPDSAELRQLRIGNEAREIYRVLYDSRDAPPTMRDIRERVPGLGEHEQFDRRRRELNRYFVIERVRDGADTRYRLVDAKPFIGDDEGISERDRAAVLSSGRCAMCGRTPPEDGVKLQVDHKIPQEWGGTNDLENLQPLCEECNRGKKAHFASYNEFAEQIKRAISHAEVHMRIGELLKAFGERSVRADLIELVANPPGHPQDDWQKRLRELRVLGWEIEVTKRKEGRRMWSHYRATHATPWPEGSVRREITRLENLRGYRRKPKSLDRST